MTSILGKGVTRELLQRGLGRLSDVTYVVDWGQETPKARQEQEQKSGLGFIRG